MTGRLDAIAGADPDAGTLPAGLGLVVLVAVVLLAVVVLSPFLGLAIDALYRYDPGLAHDLELVRNAPGGWDFGRVFRRSAMILLLPAAWLLRRRLPPFRLIGLQRGVQRLRPLVLGLGIGTASFAVLVALFVATGTVGFDPKPWTDWPYNLFEALVLGLLVGGVEEAILRGWLQENLSRRRALTVAILITSVPYAVLHYFRAVVPVTEPGFDPWLGVRALAAHAGTIARVETVAPMVGLLLVSAVLGYAYGWSRSLPFAVGVHAGWIGTIKLGILVADRSFTIDWMWGPGGVLGRPMVWVFLLCMIGVLRWIVARSATLGRRESAA